MRNHKRKPVPCGVHRIHRRPTGRKIPLLTQSNLKPIPVIPCQKTRQSNGIPTTWIRNKTPHKTRHLHKNYKNKLLRIRPNVALRRTPKILRITDNRTPAVLPETSTQKHPLRHNLRRRLGRKHRNHLQGHKRHPIGTHQRRLLPASRRRTRTPSLNVASTQNKKMENITRNLPRNQTPNTRKTIPIRLYHK